MSKSTNNLTHLIPVISTKDNLQKVLDNKEICSIYILADENTVKLVSILHNIAPLLKDATIIEIKSGETNKNISTCIHVWQTLSNNQVNKNALLINLGGGVITDLGGFVASTFKRGIDFLNIPTTLLAMTDAAIGGKTGVDLDNFKNQIGLINSPIGIYYNSEFLYTLPEKELKSGFAEVLKHGLISNKAYWSDCTKTKFSDLDWDKVISGSIKIKSTIVQQDPNEKGERKLLNFGHTIGHAIETFMMNRNTPILHGEAVAIGMICESFLSGHSTGLPKEDLKEITEKITTIFPKINMDKSSFPALIELMKNDKKNMSNEINFSLLKTIGKGVFNQNCEEELIKASLEYYTTL